MRPRWIIAVTIVGAMMFGGCEKRTEESEQRVETYGEQVGERVGERGELAVERAEQAQERAEQVAERAEEHAEQVAERAEERAEAAEEGAEERSAGIEERVEARERVPVAGERGGATAQNIAQARCAREQRCGNVGAGEEFASNEACLSEIRSDWADDLNGYDCPDGIDQAELSECLEEIRNEDCGNPFDSLGRITACRVADICE